MDSRTQVTDLTKGTERIIQLLEEAKQIAFSQLPPNETQQQRRRVRQRSKSCGNRRAKRCQEKQATGGLSKYHEHFSRPRQRRNKYGEQRPRSHGNKPLGQDVKIFIQNKPAKQKLLRSASVENLQDPDNLHLKAFQQQSRSCPNLLLQEEVEASHIEQLIGEEEFANWTKCVLALNRVRQASSNVLEYKFRILTAKFNEGQLALFLTCLNKNEIKHLKRNQKGERVRKKREWKCEHNDCRTILKELLQTYCIDQTSEWTIRQSKPEAPNQMQTSNSSDAEADKNRWFWLIGRLFSDSEIHDSAYRDLEKLDISQMIKVHRNCRLFEFDGSAEVYDKILSKRNGLMHSTENMVSKGYLDETFEILFKLLLHFSKEVGSCKSSYDELRELKEDILVASMIKQSDDPVEQALKCKEEAVKSDLYFSDEKQTDQLIKLLSTTSEQLTSLQMEKGKIEEKRKAMEEDFKMLRSGTNEIESKCLEFEKAYHQQTEQNKKHQDSLKIMQQTIDELEAKNKKLEQTILSISRYQHRTEAEKKSLAGQLKLKNEKICAETNLRLKLEVDNKSWQALCDQEKDKVKVLRQEVEEIQQENLWNNEEIGRLRLAVEDRENQIKKTTEEVNKLVTSEHEKNEELKKSKEQVKDFMAFLQMATDECRKNDIQESGGELEQGRRGDDPLAYMLEAQEDIAKTSEIAYLALKDHPGMASEVCRLVCMSYRQHSMTLALIKSFVMTSSTVLKTIVPLIKAAVKIKESVFLKAMLLKLSKFCEEMRDDIIHFRQGDVEPQTKVLRDIHEVIVTGMTARKKRALIYLRTVRKSESLEVPESLKDASEQLTKIGYNLDTLGVLIKAMSQNVEVAECFTEAIEDEECAAMFNELLVDVEKVHVKIKLIKS